METTDIFKEAINENSTISWKDIFSESFKKHSETDLEYVLQTGSLSRRIPKSQMLKQWHRPWLWWVFAKYGLSLVLLLYAVCYLCMFYLGGITESLIHMVMIIPPIVIPLIIMVFMWELNVPQDISIMDLISYFLCGGIISFLVNSFFFIPFPDSLPQYYAPLREEPAKFIAALLILLYIERVKKHRIYGFTGLVVGAAVGAAFSGIESMTYAINNSSNWANMINVQLTRSLLVLGGHITYCVPYATAMALNCKDQKLTVQSILNPMTVGSLLFSVGLHAIWNGSGNVIILIGIVIGGCFILLYWVRRALQNIVKICLSVQDSTDPFSSYRRKEPVSRTITVLCKNTALAGMQWQSNGNILTLGRQMDKCTICFPENNKGVSREHCRILWKNNEWYLQDMNSRYGTFTTKGKLTPYQLYPLYSGENIYLGSKQVWLTIL